MALLLDHPHGTLTHLRRIPPLSSLLCHGSNLSRNGASGKPGEVQYLNRVAPDARVRFVVTRKQSNKLANQLFEQIKESGKLLTAPRGGSNDYLILSQSKQFQDRLENGSINTPLQSLWGSKAVKEIKAVAAAVREELGA